MCFSIALIFAASDPEKRSRGIVLLASHVFNEKLGVTSIRRAKDIYKTTGLKERLSKYHNGVDHAFWGWNDIWLQPDFMQWNIEEYRPTINIPMLHIQGKDDQYGSIAQADAIKRQSICPVDITILGDCGHSPS